MPFGQFREFVRKGSVGVPGVSLQVNVLILVEFLTDNKNFRIRNEQGVCDAFPIPGGVEFAFEMLKAGLVGKLFVAHVQV